MSRRRIVKLAMIGAIVAAVGALAHRLLTPSDGVDDLDDVEFDYDDFVASAPDIADPAE